MKESLDLTALSGARFDAFYADRIEPIFVQAEQERQDGVKTFRQRMIGASGAAVGFAALVLVLAHDGRFAAFALFIVLVIGAVFAYAPLASLSARVKLGFLTSVAAALSVSYTASGPKPAFVDRCRSLDLLPGYDRARFEDFFAGVHHGCSFELVEAHLESERRGSKGERRHVNVFRGQVIRIAFPKAFLGVTLVRRDAGVFNGLRGLGTLKRVGLADPRFEKIFEVYSTDQVEGRDLVHPVFMERLMSLEESFQGKSVRCGFEAGDLIVALESPNQFEIGDMFKPLNTPERARRIVSDVASVMALIDTVLTAERAPLVGRIDPSKS